MFRTSLLVLVSVVLVFGASEVEGQIEVGAVKTFELETIFDYSGKTPRSRHGDHTACINLATLVRRCGTKNALIYGERSGLNWDMFQIGGSQTRMVRIGKYELDDAFEVPYIEPWRRLEPGERRNLFIDASGADGEHGRNGDGTPGSGPPRREGYADKPVSKQVSSTITRPDGTQVPDNYSPYMQIKKGTIYAVRVFDEGIDHYLLIRVDDLVRGKKVVLSVKRVDRPSKN
jgi:hypothetical protein